MSDRYTEVVPLGENGDVYIVRDHVHLGGLYDALGVLVKEYDYTLDDMDNLESPIFTYLTETWDEANDTFLYKQSHPTDDGADPWTVFAARGAWRLP